MKRTTTMLAGLGAAGALFLAGCGGSDSATATTSAAPTSAQSSASVSTSTGATSSADSTTATSAASSATSSADSTESADSTGSSTGASPSLPIEGPTATTTVGGDTTTLDEQSTAWFDTACSGLAPLTQLGQSASQVSDPTQLGSILTQLGGAMTTTASSLGSLPPPTFEGGDALAEQTTAALGKFGPSLSALGAKAATLSPTDTAGGQQFLGELQSTFSELPGLLAFDVTPDLQKAIAAVPSCTALVPAS